MGLIRFAMRRPITVLVAVIAIMLTAALALRRMSVDIFPKLNLPIIYVAQPYGGMDPAQMEGFLTNYYEYHFLYITGIHHVESKNIQGVALMKLFFHPGTNMAQAMAETINYVNRSRAFMPPGTVSPFVMRFDTGSVPVGYLVLSSETKTIAEIQDQALFKVRPMFASLPGVSAPPPFGGSQRTVVVRVDPDRLRAYHVSPEEVISAVSAGNTISPSGNVHIGDQYPIVPVNSIVPRIDELGSIPIRNGVAPAVYVRDIGTIADSMDIPSGYALVNGRRAVYILVTKRADASTLDVVRNVKEALPKMRAVLPDDIKVAFEFDQSPYVTRAIAGLGYEGLLGAGLTGLMVLVFLRDWRSALVVVVNIPLSLMTAVIVLWLTGETINLMTLGGLALAIGVLVDEATVAIENIHTHMRKGGSLARAVFDGTAETAIPRSLAMLCILAVFIPSFFMQGAARALFVPMSLAVGCSMLASYILSSTLVPVLCTWLLRHGGHESDGVAGAESSSPQPETTPSDAAGGSETRPQPPTVTREPLFVRMRDAYARYLHQVVRGRVAIVPLYFVIAGLGIWLLGARLGMEIFPNVDAGQFRLRLRAPDGTHFEQTERIALDVLDVIKQKVGADKIDITLGYVGTVPSSYPINTVYYWSRGPEEATLWVSLKHGSGVRVEPLKEDLRRALAERMPNVRFSFEPADIVSEVMSFGSATPVEVAVSGPNLAENREYAEKVRSELNGIASLRDLQFVQSLEYPTVRVEVDRERAGMSGVTAAEVARSLVAATSSSRFVVPNYWPDPKTGIGYQVQVEIPQSEMNSMEEIETLPVKRASRQQLLLRDVARVSRGAMPGQYDRYNMRRMVSMTANIAGEDLGRVSRKVAAAVSRAGEPPRGAHIDVRGQVPTMQEMLTGLATGLGLAVVVIFLLLAANYQSLRLSLITVSTAPAAIFGVVIVLFLTRTTLNIQSFIGAIMAVGVAMANAILLVTFAERSRHGGQLALAAAVDGAHSRLRPILMTSFAMMAGMLPMALGLGESGEQTAPLGRAVIGGLAAATVATLFVLPCVFALVQGRTPTRSASLDPDDAESPHYAR
jgi:multidrug efflux pump subunit AcrB